MKIDRLYNDKGNFRCFEVNNTTISRHGMATVVLNLKGVEIIHTPKFYDDEVFCIFTFMGHTFEITEPYGDSSVYDVVAPENAIKEMETIAKHFENSMPVKGGDSGHRAFFLANWCLGSFFLMGLIYGIVVGVKYVFS